MPLTDIMPRNLKSDGPAKFVVQRLDFYRSFSGTKLC